MNYASINPNDTVNGEGVCVSLWVQGCPIHCDECFNPEAWDPDDGELFSRVTIDEIINLINANEVQRNFSVLGGEPFHEDNVKGVDVIIKTVRLTYPDIKIYIWSGYYLEDLLKRNDKRVNDILKQADYLIDGPYVKELRDVTLKWRGSSNQRIIDLQKVENL